MVDSLRSNSNHSPPVSDTTADQINNYLTSIFQPSDTDMKDLTIELSVDSSNWCMPIVNDEIEAKIRQLSDKGCGSDGIPNRLLKVAAHLLSKPLSHLFNTSTLLMSVPDLWKMSKIVPIPKCKNPTVTDYRPISLLPVVSKILERCILDRIYPTLVNNYGTHQFGFRKKSSTTCAVIAMYDDMTRNWEMPQVKGISVISFDASKAFDTVPYDILLRRLLSTDISTGFIEWFRSYLINRQQFVDFNGFLSGVSRVTSGVPQGAILSPAMFCVFVAPLNVVNRQNGLYKYADDVYLTLCHTSTSEDASLCRAELDNNKTWFTTNRTKLNERKTSRMLLSKSDSFKPSYDCLTTIQEVTSLKVLGITLSNDFSWSTHVSNSVKKASRNLYLLRILRPMLPKKDLVILHNALIQSSLDYGSSLYVGSIKASDRALIKRTVQRSHRLICGSNCNLDCLQNPDERRLLHALNLFKAALYDDGHVLHSRVPRFLRSGRRLDVRYQSSRRRASSFVPFMTVHFNKD